MNTLAPVVLTTTPDWARLVQEIVDGDSTAFEKLYKAFLGLRWYFQRRGCAGHDVEDLFHETILCAFVQIRNGNLRDPECIGGYVASIARNKLLSYFDGVSQRRKDSDSSEGFDISDGALSAESKSIRNQERAIMQRILKSMPHRDREVLIRFYLNEHTPEDIQRELGLTETQFRLVKSRAKQRFAELTRNRLKSKPSRSMQNSETAWTQSACLPA